MRCITLVRFPAPAGLNGAKLRAVLEDAVPRYQTIPGLHRKYFLGNATHGGGVYEWESREAANAFYDETWFERLRTVYGASRSCSSSTFTRWSTTRLTPPGSMPERNAQGSIAAVTSPASSDSPTLRPRHAWVQVPGRGLPVGRARPPRRTTRGS